MPIPTPAFADYWSLRYSAGGHFVTRHFSQYLGAACAWAAQRAGLAPSQVTLCGTSAFLAGAWIFAVLPDRPIVALGCLLLFQLGYALDCADGQLARASQRASTFGAWLDIACDYVRNAALACALAVWLAGHGMTVLGVGAALSFAAGTAVHLHTVTSLRREAAVPSTPRGTAREFATAALDTPTVLLAIVLLRPFPAALGVTVAAAGAAYLCMGAVLARTRLA